MNSQPEVSSEASESCPQAKPQSAEAEQVVSDPEPLPLKANETAVAKQPTLLDRFYYWVMSRT